MPQVFRRKQFSYYLGEERAIDDIIVSYEPLIPPTPTGTPNVTPTPTSTPIISVTSTPTPTTTQTQTPTNTSTPTNTPTPSVTNTQTPTLTSTPTNTPTPSTTPNALCPQQLILSASSPSYLYGLYNRATIYTGGTFETAWYNFDDNIMNYGTNPDGNDYVAFSINSGSDYTSLYWGSDISGNDGYWYLAYSTGNTLFNGGTLISSIVLDTNSIVSGILFFPPSGNLQYNGGYINYPVSCPTPTPTATPTTTPTTTLTPSPTATNNPICPEQINIISWSGTNSFVGTYNRLWDASGSTMTYGYFNGSVVGSTGTAPDGYNYPVYKEVSSNKYLSRSVYPGATDNLWALILSSSNPWQSGGGGSATVTQGFSPTITQGSVRFPQGGNWINFGNSGYVAYPSNCPTPTPTTTTTPTPTPSGFDPDAQAFFNRVTAAGGTLTTLEKTATNQLVLDMKSNSIWGIAKAVYPMVGGSAASCSQNLISSGFTGTFNGGWTISSTGVLGNGSNTYINSQLNPTTELGLNSTHIGFYSRTNYNDPNVALDMGSTSLLYIVGWGTASEYHANNSSEFPTGLTPPTNSLGFIINNRNSSTEMSAWRQGVEYTDSTSSAAFSTTQPTYEMFLGAYNNAGSAFYNTTREYAFFTIGLGLSDVQASSYSTIVQTFQTTLGRQV
jgi:hypothetical protein